uniref:Uncharacterized protein n=1 Tax=Rousettus aegyptiacus TaxID=9407 RepID=A0A7J8DX86_ROUAE|nr:hypothetical protein HJG63_008306 [Rousettus aegyptiacus]
MDVLITRGLKNKTPALPVPRRGHWGPGPSVSGSLAGPRGPGDMSIPSWLPAEPARGLEEPPPISFAGFLVHPPHDQRELRLVLAVLKLRFEGLTLVFETVARRWPEMTVRPRWPCVSPSASAHGCGAFLRGRGGGLSGGRVSACPSVCVGGPACPSEGRLPQCVHGAWCAPDCACVCQRVVSAVEGTVGVSAARPCGA